MFKRLFMILLLSDFLCACVGKNTANLLPAFKYGIWGQKDFEITREKINSIPYASIAGKIGRGPRSLLVLGIKQDDELGWYSADKKLFITRGGRIVKTEGLPNNVSNTIFLNRDPVLEDSLGQPLIKESRRTVDFKDGENYGVLIISKYELVGRKAINIEGINYDTYLIKEKGKAEAIDWEFENLFWKDIKTGMVVMSIQYFEPETPVIKIEMLKPPA